MSCITLYSEELADEVCRAIENSVFGLKTLCKQNPHWPDRAVLWDYIRDQPYFQEKYIKAKENQAHFIFDEMMEVAYDDKKDHKVIVDDDGNERIIVVSEAVNRSRLKVDTLKLTAAKLAPKKYGEKLPSDSGDKANTLLEKLIDKL